MATTEFTSPAPQAATLSPDQLHDLFRIQRTRKAGFVPSLGDIDSLLEFVDLLLGGAR